MVMYAFTYEADFLRAGLEQLKAYLLSDELFWNLGLRAADGSPPYPQLTLGNLLLSEARLQGLVAGDETLADQDEEAEEMVTRFGELRAEWQVAWETKAEKEFGVRLRQWARFLDDTNNSPSLHQESYASQVRVRTIIELLGKYVPQTLNRMLAELSVQDKRLKVLTISGDFVWEKEYEAGFPKENYWFLYVQPKSGE